MFGTYQVYGMKTQPQGNAESQLDFGYASNPDIQQGVTPLQAVGGAALVMRVLPAGKNVINTVSNASGNTSTKLFMSRIGDLSAIGFGIKAFGWQATLAVEAATRGAEMVAIAVENRELNINQEYKQQKLGARIDKFVGRGNRID